MLPTLPLAMLPALATAGTAGGRAARGGELLGELSAETTSEAGSGRETCGGDSPKAKWAKRGRWSEGNREEGRHCSSLTVSSVGSCSTCEGVWYGCERVKVRP